MKRLTVTLLLLCGMMIPAALWAAEEQPAAPDKRIDLKLTSKYIASEWTNRKEFPDSVTFAYYNVYCLKALGKGVSAEQKKKIITFLKSCQRQDGGFAPDPAYAQRSNIVFTFYALKTLSLLDSLDAIDRNKLVAHLKPLVQADGGIKGVNRPGEKADLATTYYGLEALDLLKAPELLHRDKTVAFVQSYREKGQGFGRMPGKPSMPLSTMMGVRSLLLLNALKETDRQEIIAHIKTTRYSGLVKDRKYPDLPTVEDMAATLETMTDLSAMGMLDLPAIHTFIESLYIPENGGFGPQPGYGTTPPSTYYGIVCLVKLGQIKDPLLKTKTVR